MNQQLYKKTQQKVEKEQVRANKTGTSQVGAIPKTQKALKYALTKCRNTLRVPFVLGKRFKSSDIACRDKWERLFSNFRLLRSKTQYSSDTTSKIRIWRFTLDLTSKIRIVLEKFFCRLMLREPNIRQNMRILNSLIARKM